MESDDYWKVEPEKLVFSRNVPSKKSIKITCPTKSELKIASSLSCDFELVTLNSKRDFCDPAGTALSEHELVVTYTPSFNGPVENRMLIKVYSLPRNSHKLMRHMFDDNERPTVHKDIHVSFEGEDSDVVEECTEFLKCSLCLQEFEESIESLLPTYLSCCGRQLCFGCFEQLKNWNYCPFERTPVSIGSKAKKNEGILQVMRSRKEKTRNTEQQPRVRFVEDPDIPCFENSHHESSLYCGSCDAHFCEGCFTKVHEPKVFSTHRSISLISKPVIVPKCQKHPTMPTEFVCQEPSCRNESKLMCQNCLLTVHRSHGYDNLSEKIEENQHKLQRMKEKITTFESNIQTRLDNVKDAGASFQQDSEQMKSTILKVSNHFDEMKRKELNYLQEFSKVRMSQLKKRQDTLERDLHLTKVTKREIERMLILKNKLHSIDEIMGPSEAVCAHNAANADTNVYLRLDQLNCHVEGDLKLRISDK